MLHRVPLVILVMNLTQHHRPVNQLCALLTVALVKQTSIGRILISLAFPVETIVRLVIRMDAYSAFQPTLAFQGLVNCALTVQESTQKEQLVNRVF